MIFNKLPSLRSFRSTAVIFRNYNDFNFQPSRISKDKRTYFKKLQQQRKRLQVQADKCIPSEIYIQVIGPGNRAGCRSILLVTDDTNYLFNCGEGTQRLASEYHDELTKIEHIFVTKPSWDNIGGILGVALTVQDRGVPILYFHGPNGSSDIIEATENFLNLKDLSVVTADTTKTFSDQTMTVTYIPILNPKLAKNGDSVNNNLSPDNITYFNYEMDPYDNLSRFSNSTKKKILKVRSSDCMSQIDSMMVFVCKIHGKDGILDFEKCVEKGIMAGPNLKKLQSGEDITLEDGKIVRSKDVTTTETGILFIVLECPSEDWIDVIVNNPAFQKYQHETVTDKDEVVRYIVHFSPENVLQNSKYKEWIRKFGLKTEHLIINENNNGYTSVAQHKLQHQLHLLHPNIFPHFGDQQNVADERNNEKNNLKKLEIDRIEETLKKHCESSDSTTEFKRPENENEVKTSTATNNNQPIIHQCQTLSIFHLRPDEGLDMKMKIEIHPKKYVKEIINTRGFFDVHADLKKKLNDKTKTLGDLKEYPKLLMLGTGSSVCSDYRNRSGILLQLDEDRSIILDCGEGTMGQLLTFFGKSKIDRVLKSIKAIYISHLHVDHHLGLIGIIKQRERVTNEPLFLLAPQHICLYLHFYHNRFESIIQQFQLVSNRDLLINECTLDPDLAKDMYGLLGVDNISTTFVKHCVYAYGVAITLKDGRKICYSGDSMPCDNMVKLANNSFLLIHEATMEDVMETEAVMSRHSTISQAINVGEKANAQFTLLTHFSPASMKIPLLPSTEQNSIDLNRVGIAYDFMSVSLSELPVLSCFYPCLKHMFYKQRILMEEPTFLKHDKKNIRKNFTRALNLR